MIACHSMSTTDLFCRLEDCGISQNTAEHVWLAVYVEPGAT